MKEEKKKRLRAGSLLAIPVMAVSLLPMGVSANGASPTGQTTAGNGFIAAQSAGSSGAVKQPNPADVKFSQDQAIAKMRELFPVLKDAEVQQVELGNHNQYPLPENQMVWSIQWSYSVGNGGYGFSSQVDAITGDLIQVGLYGPMLQANDVYYPPKLTREQASAAAKEFIKKAVPSIPIDQFTEREAEESYQNRPLFGPVRYSFSLDPTINGIRVPDAAISIEMDGNGNVYQFHRMNEVSQYPSGQPKLTAEEAKNKVQTATDLNLTYIPVRSGNQVSWFLAWKGQYPVIDAQTGEFLSNEGEPAASVSPAFKDLPDTGNKFVPANPAAGQLTGDEAAAIVQKFMTVPADRQLQSKTLGKYRSGMFGMNENEHQVWNLTWRNPEERVMGPWAETFASVDAKTGQILQYREERFQGPSKEQNPGNSVSMEVARQKALEIVTQMYPDAQTELKQLDNNQVIPKIGDGYQFQFQRFYQQIPVEQEGVSVSIDKSGKIIWFSINRTPQLDSKLKGLAAKVTKEQATAKYLADLSIKLQYQTFRSYLDQSRMKSVTKLVYRSTLKDNMYPNYVIDAATGEWRSAWEPNLPVQNTAAEAKDIDGHWAKDSIATLVKYGILVPDKQGKVNPDATITGGEWLQMMVKAVNPYYDRNSYGDIKPVFAEITKDSPYFNAVNHALQARWLDPKDKNLRLEQPLSREDLAVSLTRILQYDKLSAYLNGGTNSFKDIDQVQARGAVLIVQQLGLLQGSDGYFRPGDKVTRAQAASVMMRLVQLQGKTDQDITGNRY